MQIRARSAASFRAGGRLAKFTNCHAVLAVKIEVDTNLRAGAGLDTAPIRRHVTFRLHHHDRASLLADKLHAFFQRRYVKGRYLHDLLWYLSDPDWPAPNLTLLQNALEQTGWDGPIPE